MGTVIFSENRSSLMIPYEDGKPLCSPSTPQEEGAKWVYGLGHLPTNHVVVVGLGAGHHVAALHDIYPHIQITVIERRDSLLQMFKRQYPELSNVVEVICLDRPEAIRDHHCFQAILDQGVYVVSFRESWGLQSGFYTELFAHATGRDMISLNYHFSEMEINLKSLFNPQTQRPQVVFLDEGLQSALHELQGA